MKKILIITLLSLMAFTTSAYAKMGKHALMHANPLPNLVRVAMQNKDTLNITASQMQAIKAWGKVNKPKVMSLIHLVMTEEKMLMEESLTTDSDVIVKAATMLEARKQIIIIKTKCRENLKKVLSKVQYAQLVTMYKKAQK